MTPITDLIDEFVAMELEDDDWDMPPMLFFVGAEPPDRPTIAVVSLAVEGDPVVTLQQFAYAMGNLDHAVPPFLDMDNPLTGLILKYEGWGLSSESGMNEEEMREYVAHNRISEHPARKEMKGFLGVDTAGLYGASWLRGEEPKAAAQIEDRALEGRLPDAVKALYDAIIFREQVSRP